MRYNHSKKKKLQCHPKSNAKRKEKLYNNLLNGENSYRGKKES